MIFIDKEYKARIVSVPTNSGICRRLNWQSIVAKRKGVLILKITTVWLYLVIVLPVTKRTWPLGRDCTIGIRYSEKGKRKQEDFFNLQD